MQDFTSRLPGLGFQIAVIMRTSRAHLTWTYHTQFWGGFWSNCINVITLKPLKIIKLTQKLSRNKYNVARLNHTVVVISWLSHQFSWLN